MSKGILLGTLSADGALVKRVESFAASRYSVFIDGDYSGGSVAFEASADGITYVPIMITNPADGLSSVLVATLFSGIYSFAALCAWLRFDLTGATTPDLDFHLFPEPRS